MKHSDIVLRTPCYEAFMKVLEDSELLDSAWKEWQEAVADYRRENHKAPRDSYLVFLVSPENPSATPALVDRIVNDGSVCRKCIVSSNGEGLSAALTRLPFLAYEGMHEQTWAAPAHVLDVLKRKA